MTTETNKIRRLVTGYSEEGKSVIISDTLINSISLGGGKSFLQLWASDSTPVHQGKPQMEEQMNWFPEAGGSRFFLWVVPPKTNSTNPQLSTAEIDQLLPGFTKHFEPENPGMHTTRTVDCTYLISGSIVLELENHQKVQLNAGDSIIQNGTRHRWLNHGNIPAVLISSCIGAEKK